MSFGGLYFGAYALTTAQAGVLTPSPVMARFVVATPTVVRGPLMPAPVVLRWIVPEPVVTNIESVEPVRGKYAAEHRGALADLTAARGFASEHTSALRDLVDAGV